MKKNFVKSILSIFILVSAISISSTVSAQADCANLTADINYAQNDTVANGYAVSILQAFLQKNGYLQTAPTGYFGGLTLSAVKAFQSANGINSTGYVGPTTRAKIQNLDCNYSSVTTNATIKTTSTQTDCANLTADINYAQSDTVANGYAVSILQAFLQKNGYLQTAPTGYFGGLTLSAVKAFQSANGINPTGFVGSLTRTKIQNLDCNYTSTATKTAPASSVPPIANKIDSFAPTITLNANPVQVLLGQPTTLEWSSNNAVDECKITSKDTSGKMFSSAIDLSGSKSSGPINKTTTYTVVCYNKYGIPGSKSMTVKVVDSLNTTSVASQQTFIKAATITSINPSSGNRGSTVIVKGSGFLSANKIIFDGAEIDSSLILSQSSTSISFKIPEYKSCLTSYCPPPKTDTAIETGGTKIIQVSNVNGFSNDFIFTLPSKIITILGVASTTTYSSKLAVNSITPASGNRGDKAAISGSGFSSDSIVLFGGLKVADNLILSRSNSSISFIVPPFKMGCTEPEYEICPRLPIAGSGTIIETGGIKTVSVMNTSSKATSTSVTFTLPSKKITY